MCVTGRSAPDPLGPAALLKIRIIPSGGSHLAGALSQGLGPRLVS